MKAYFWILFDTTIGFLGGISYPLYMFLVWENEQSLEDLIFFNLITLLSWLVFSFVSSLIAQLTSIKLAYGISIVLRIITAFYVVTFFNHISDLIVPMSILVGSYSAFATASRPLVEQVVITNDDRIKLSSYKQIFSSFLRIVTPFLVFLLIDNFGYEDPIKLLGFIFIGYLIIFPFFGMKDIDHRFYLHKLFKSLFTNKVSRNVALIATSLGVNFSLGFGLLDILILLKFETLQNWSNVNIVLAILAVLIAFYLRKIQLSNVSKTRGIIGLASLLFISVPYLYLSNFTQTSFFIFSVARTVFSTISSVLTRNYIYRVEIQDPEYKIRQVSYQMFNDIFMNIGQITPLLILFVLPNEIINETSMIMAIAIIASVPYAFLGAFKHNFYSIKNTQ